MIAPIERSGLIVTDIEVLRLHYAETLKAWRASFIEHWDKAAELYDEAFCRMWDFYLASSEVAFRWQDLVVFQIQLAHDPRAVPLTRDYMSDGEKAPHRAQESQRIGPEKAPRSRPSSVRGIGLPIPSPESNRISYNFLFHMGLVEIEHGPLNRAEEQF